MLLQYLIEDLESPKINGETNINIEKIEYDSKKITKGDLFVAIEGFKEDGHNYIEEAIKNGVVAVIVKKDTKVKPKNITIIEVEDTRTALAKAAIAYYGNPASKLKMIGVTGTKGKTTTVYMIRDILLASGKKTGMIGTIFNTFGKKEIEATKTSPESLDLQKLLKEMVDAGMEYVVMEVSSHALELKRVYGIHFIVGLFTNLSKDHLDFHETMDSYLKAKAKLFKECDFAIINADDIYTCKLEKMIECKTAKYGLDNESNITAVDIRINNNYVDFKMYINKMLQTITVKIPGRYTVYNALGAIAVTSMLGAQMEEILMALSNVKVPGRSEVVDIEKTFAVLLDYAHSPASLEAILSNTKRYSKGRIICVFGCGGNRDTEKRPIMGEISGKYSDFTVITTDNPRDEEPKKIMSEIENGIKKTRGLYKIIENRKEAIKFAMRIAWKNDTIIIAGKGHETYQILKNNKKIKFDEREVVKEIANEMLDKNLETM
ncbi:MAG: UDP-N-acetylmuramoyl-L-alanyl-D-glutamate--2,6-diaminopimelate ligase [Clostridia bacterium]|nr:UDP-N-acetylmuramoyl-L-alanyl-D-glutamate--2,6-diaminopimelate ligase [Clostridia bacterium]MDD4375464.1 UDP-N-acetylmuramoyl-L-alanyl-D-glutamate--2,6-diaminopimelate ligase [Clostridia bacterium]